MTLPAEIWDAEDRRPALDAVKSFEGRPRAKFPRAVAMITGDVEVPAQAIITLWARAAPG